MGPSRLRPPALLALAASAHRCGPLEPLRNAILRLTDITGPSGSLAGKPWLPLVHRCPRLAGPLGPGPGHLAALPAPELGGIASAALPWLIAGGLLALLSLAAILTLLALSRRRVLVTVTDTLHPGRRSVLTRVLIPHLITQTRVSTRGGRLVRWHSPGLSRRSGRSPDTVVLVQVRQRGSSWELTTLGPHLYLPDEIPRTRVDLQELVPVEFDHFTLVMRRPGRPRRARPPTASAGIPTIPTPPVPEPATVDVDASAPALEFPARVPVVASPEAAAGADGVIPPVRVERPAAATVSVNGTARAGQAPPAVQPLEHRGAAEPVAVGARHRGPGHDPRARTRSAPAAPTPSEPPVAPPGPPASEASATLDHALRQARDGEPLALVVQRPDAGPPVTCTLAKRPLSRMGGYLRRDADRGEGGLLLYPASSVHTFGMRFPIHIVYLSPRGQVLRVQAHIPPWRVGAMVRGTRAVLELPADDIPTPPVEVGDTVLVAFPFGSHDR